MIPLGSEQSGMDITESFAEMVDKKTEVLAR